MEATCGVMGGGIVEPPTAPKSSSKRETEATVPDGARELRSEDALFSRMTASAARACLLYTSDAADE